MPPDQSKTQTPAGSRAAGLLGRWGIGYVPPCDDWDWVLMKIFDTKEAAEADLPNWGNPIAPPETFSVREIDEELADEAQASGCPSMFDRDYHRRLAMRLDDCFRAGKTVTDEDLAAAVAAVLALADSGQPGSEDVDRLNWLEAECRAGRVQLASGG